MIRKRMQSGLRALVAATGFLLVAAFFLSTEQRAQLFGILPYVLLLACPFLHVFMHGGHGRHETPPRAIGATHTAPAAEHDSAAQIRL